MRLEQGCSMQHTLYVSLRCTPVDINHTAPSTSNTYKSPIQPPPCCCCWCPQAYQGAVQALGAVADRLRSSPGRFFFGDKPSSLDALLLGHLAFYKHSPVAAPVLREKVGVDGGGACLGLHGLFWGRGCEEGRRRLGRGRRACMVSTAAGSRC